MARQWFQPRPWGWWLETAMIGVAFIVLLLAGAAFLFLWLAAEISC